MPGEEQVQVASSDTSKAKARPPPADVASDASSFGDEDEDEQIRRKESLLQELLKIERQLECQKSCHEKAEETASNYDHISMINKYLIKKCQYDLNRLYKLKLRQLQKRPLELREPAEQPASGVHALSLSSISNSLVEFKRQQAGAERAPGGPASTGGSSSTPVSLSQVQTTMFFKASSQKQQVSLFFDGREWNGLQLGSSTLSWGLQKRDKIRVEDFLGECKSSGAKRALENEQKLEDLRMLLHCCVNS